MGMVYFTNGRELEMSRKDTDNLANALKEGGVRTFHSRDLDPKQIIVITNCPVSHIVMDYKQLPPVVIEPEEKAPTKQADSGPAESAQERNERALAEMMARSSCNHEDKLTYHRIEGKRGTRYFPVCTFCGWKGKFVAAESLTDEVKSAALLMQEE